MTVSLHPALLRGTAALALGAGVLAFQSQPAQACAYEPVIGSVCAVAASWCPRGFVAANGQELQVNQNQALFSLLGFTYGGNNSSIFNVPDLRGRTIVGVNPTQVTGITSPLPLGTKRGAENITLSPTQVPLLPHTHPATFTAISGPSQITIPAQAGSGTALTGTGTVDVVPGIPSASPPGASNPTAGTTYYLTGGKANAPSSLVGPYTTTAPTAGSTASVGNVKVSVDATGLVPATPQRTIDVNMINGGTVAVGTTGSAATAQVNVINPEIALTYCIATQGLYPDRP